MIRASIVGGSGYTGGELLRLLLGHPEVEIMQATSQKHLGEYVYQTHPNLRKQTSLKFSAPDDLEPCDVLFLAMPHGKAQHHINQYAALAEAIMDLSADFRLQDPETYKKWYGAAHAAPHWLDKFVYGLPELHRDEIKHTKYISGVGCNATACNLAMLPLVKAGLVNLGQPVIFEIKVGSSEGGASVNPGSHHPERSGVVRTFSSFGHRHTAEVIQELNLQKPALTISSIDLVRGALATAHVIIDTHITKKELWKAYRAVVNENPCLRLVKERRGVYRVPEPKILAGSNYADLGFEWDAANGHLVAMCAIDNLMKGASGSAVQSMNLMCGFDEMMGLSFPGLHPI
ncbi:MAG: N-acetyl-gamma-glutamyl-phosphate reductase [Anaerolineaceae bacterium]|nr:N-acetyl-gamma-glutamyl-phosphate reductase [Anaerolineaceae bacterium]